MSEWKEGKLIDLVNINPNLKLSKGEKYPFVSMDIIQPYYKPVEAKEEREFKSGGAKFENGDTLFARITPCLENGKIAQVKNLKKGKGFGSTEFIVLRGKEGITDTDFVYYLSINKAFRENAERLMVGTSGRQRVDRQQFENQVISIPDIETQKRISSILSSIDSKIELNMEMNKTLEEMAMILYKHWFVDFRPFQDGEFVESELGMIPKGWEIKEIGDVIELAYGKALKKTDRIEGDLPVYGSSGIVGYHNKSLVEGPGIIVGRKGNVGTIFWSETDFYPIDTTFYINNISGISMYYIYYSLQNMNFSVLGSDSAVPGLNRNIAYKQRLIIPEKEGLLRFDKKISNMFIQMKLINEEIKHLEILRDYLLPRLLSGEIDVTKAEKQVENIL